METYKEWIEKLKREWIGKSVLYQDRTYNVVDVDYNGMLLINKKAEQTDTTAVSITSITVLEENKNTETENGSMSLAHEIVELFEQLLDQKGIEIPCEDKTEQKERYDGGNKAKLYGMEYGELVDKIEFLLDKENGY